MTWLLPLLLVLSGLSLPSARVHRYRVAEESGTCGDEAPMATLPAGSRRLCALLCEQVPTCTTVQYGGTVCRLYQWRPLGVPGSLLSRQKAAPEGYSLCQDRAYRVLDYAPRDTVLRACRGRLALPLRQTQRLFLAELVDRFGRGLQDIEEPEKAYIDGVIECDGVAGGCSFRRRSGGEAIDIPVEVWAKVPTGDYNRFIAIMEDGMLHEWNDWSLLMSTCEVEIELDTMG